MMVAPIVSMTKNHIDTRNAISSGFGSAKLKSHIMPLNTPITHFSFPKFIDQPLSASLHSASHQRGMNTSEQSMIIQSELHLRCKYLQLPLYDSLMYLTFIWQHLCSASPNDCRNLITPSSKLKRTARRVNSARTPFPLTRIVFPSGHEYASTWFRYSMSMSMNTGVMEGSKCVPDCPVIKASASACTHALR